MGLPQPYHLSPAPASNSLYIFTCEATVLSPKHSIRHSRILSSTQFTSNWKCLKTQTQTSSIADPPKDGVLTAMTLATVLQTNWPPALTMKSPTINEPTLFPIEILQSSSDVEATAVPPPKIVLMSSITPSTPFTATDGIEASGSREMPPPPRANLSPLDWRRHPERHRSMCGISRKWSCGATGEGWPPCASPPMGDPLQAAVSKESSCEKGALSR